MDTLLESIEPLEKVENPALFQLKTDTNSFPFLRDVV
jgi:hypothetical protein